MIAISFWDDFWDIFKIVGGVCSVAILSFCLIAWPISYYEAKVSIERYYAVKETIENSRLSEMDSIERAAIQNKITEVNADLAEMKYWNGTIFDWYIPDEVEELEPLK